MTYKACIRRSDFIICLPVDTYCFSYIVKLSKLKKKLLIILQDMTENAERELINIFLEANLDVEITMPN